MALVRILIDGYSLLHAWRELAPGHAPHSAKAREALVRQLTRYQDMTGVPLTIFFDGQGAPAGTPKVPSTPQVEILYSRQGQTADDMIERVTYRLRPFGEVLAVTNDNAERDTVIAMGGHAQSCEAFIGQVEAVLGEMEGDLQRYNRNERNRYNQK
jgi:predicted RNA-binding protein with PIN domain